MEETTATAMARTEIGTGTRLKSQSLHRHSDPDLPRPLCHQSKHDVHDSMPPTSSDIIATRLSLEPRITDRQPANMDVHFLPRGYPQLCYPGDSRTFGLKPHRTLSFKLSPDPQLVAKIRDIVGLYMNPPANAAVFAVDEKSQIQALERAQPILPMDLGQPERRTHNYIRHGTLDLFAALDVVKGTVIARCKRQHRSVDFTAFLREIDESVPSDLDIHVIVDNLSAHKSPVVGRWLARNPRFKLHFTPTYASWLNLVERFFGLLTEEALRRGSHTKQGTMLSLVTPEKQVPADHPLRQIKALAEGAPRRPVVEGRGSSRSRSSRRGRHRVGQRLVTRP
jgi:transposase